MKVFLVRAAFPAIAILIALSTFPIEARCQDKGKDASTATATPTPATLEEKIDSIAKNVEKVQSDLKAVRAGVEADQECPGYSIEPGTAETNCPVYADLSGGVELQHADDFSDVFPLVRIRARAQLPPFLTDTQLPDEDCQLPASNTPESFWERLSRAPRVDARKTTDFVFRPHGYLDVALSSNTTTDEKKDSDGKFDPKAVQAWDFSGGVLTDLVDWRFPGRRERFVEELQGRRIACESVLAAQERVKVAEDHFTDWQKRRNAELHSLKPTSKGSEAARIKEMFAEWSRVNDTVTSIGTTPEKFPAARRAELLAAKAEWDKKLTEHDQLAQKHKELNDRLAQLRRWKAPTNEIDAVTGEVKATETKMANNQTDSARLASDLLPALERELAWTDLKVARERTRLYRIRYSQMYAPNMSVALVGEVGGITTEDSNDLLQHHFAGVRIYFRGYSSLNRLNGMSLDVGWGISENFRENTDKRIKFRGQIPFTLTREGAAPVKAFVRLDADSDFRDGADELKISIGASVDFNKVLSTLGLGL